MRALERATLCVRHHAHTAAPEAQAERVRLDLDVRRTLETCSMAARPSVCPPLHPPHPHPIVRALPTSTAQHIHAHPTTAAPHRPPGQLHTPSLHSGPPARRPPPTGKQHSWSSRRSSGPWRSRSSRTRWSPVSPARRGTERERVSGGGRRSGRVAWQRKGDGRVGEPSGSGGASQASRVSRVSRVSLARQAIQ